MCLGHSYQTDFQFNITNIHRIDITYFQSRFSSVLFSFFVLLLPLLLLLISYNIFCCFLWLLAVFDFTHKISLFASFCFLISGTAAQVTSRAQPTISHFNFTPIHWYGMVASEWRMVWNGWMVSNPIQVKRKSKTMTPKTKTQTNEKECLTIKSGLRKWNTVFYCFVWRKLLVALGVKMQFIVLGGLACLPACLCIDCGNGGRTGIFTLARCEESEADEDDGNGGGIPRWHSDN